MPFRIGDPSEASVFILMPLVSDIDACGPELFEKRVEVFNAVVDHESWLTRTEISRVLLEERPDRGTEALGVAMFAPFEDRIAAGLDRDPEMRAIPIGERVYITSAKEDA